MNRHGRQGVEQVMTCVIGAIFRQEYTGETIDTVGVIRGQQKGPFKTGRSALQIAGLELG